MIYIRENAVGEYKLTVFIRSDSFYHLVIPGTEVHCHARLKTHDTFLFGLQLLFLLLLVDLLFVHGGHVLAVVEPEVQVDVLQLLGRVRHAHPSTHIQDTNSHTSIGQAKLSGDRRR